MRERISPVLPTNDLSDSRCRRLLCSSVFAVRPTASSSCLCARGPDLARTIYVPVRAVVKEKLTRNVACRSQDQAMSLQRRKRLFLTVAMERYGITLQKEHE